MHNLGIFQKLEKVALRRSTPTPLTSNSPSWPGLDPAITSNVCTAMFHSARVRRQPGGQPPTTRRGQCRTSLVPGTRAAGICRLRLSPRLNGFSVPRPPARADLRHQIACVKPRCSPHLFLCRNTHRGARPRPPPRSVPAPQGLPSPAAAVPLSPHPHTPTRPGPDADRQAPVLHLPRSLLAQQRQPAPRDQAPPEICARCLWLARCSLATTTPHRDGRLSRNNLLRKERPGRTD